MMLRPKLTLYLDVVSPFGYMAFYITRVGNLSPSCAEKRLDNPKIKITASIQQYRQEAPILYM
jgi:hypothetical protein